MTERLQEYLQAARKGGSGGAPPFGKGSLKYTLMTLGDLQAAGLLPEGTDRGLIERLQQHPEIPLDRVWEHLEVLLDPQTAAIAKRHADRRKQHLSIQKCGGWVVGYTFSPYNLMSVAFRKGCHLYVGVSLRGAVVKAAWETGRASQIIDALWEPVVRATPDLEWRRPHPDLMVGSWLRPPQDPQPIGEEVVKCCLTTLREFEE